MRRSELPGFYIGDRLVWSRIYAKYHKFVRSVIWKRGAGTITSADVDDIAQEAWQRAYSRKEYFDPGISPTDDVVAKVFMSWMAVLAYHELVNWYRSRRKDASASATTRVTEVLAIASRAFKSFESGFVELRFDLANVEGLSDEQRLVLERQKNGGKLEEIAVELGKSVSTISRISRKAQEILLASF